MIVIKRTGGLGNQLFQYAAARAIAASHPSSTILIEPETNNIHNRATRVEYKRLMKGATETDARGDIPVLSPPGGAFSHWNPEGVDLPVRLDGCFQYLPAIQGVLPSLREEMIAELEEERSTMRRYYRIEEDRAVFIHVRRGDYLYLSHYHYVLDMAYYREAYKKILETTKNPRVYLVSDDVLWCASQHWGFPLTVILEKDVFRTLAIMSLCGAGAIIANSTFSWWGAVLANPRRVCYPSNWINDAVTDLFSTDWVVVDNR